MLGIVVVIGIAYFLLDERDDSMKEVVDILEASNEKEQVSDTSKSDVETNVSNVIPKENTAKVEKEPVNKQAEPQSKVQIDAGGYAIVQGEVVNPTYVNGVLLASKKYPLPKTYNPGEDPTAKQAMDTMILAAKKAGFSIVAFSSFRSYDYQKNLYDKYVARDGQAKADRYSARPGHSEHQTGLSFDVGEVGRENLWLTSEFGETPAGQWLAGNAYKYGFILRYPKGKEEITGFMHESWHFRYLGVELATKVFESGLTLEEYLGVE